MTNSRGAYALQRCTLISLAALAATLGACATLPPSERAQERALYNDVRTLVISQERSEWVLDRDALENMAPGLLNSVCRAPAEARQGLARWLDDYIEGLGGSAEAVYAKSGGDLGAAGDILRAERVRAALAYASERAQECPFWLQPEAPFEGIQGDGHRFVLLAESRGNLSLYLNTRDVGAGGGGAGRLIPAGGVDETLTIGAGLEIGGSGLFSSEGEVTATIIGAIPLLFRFNDSGRLLDLELAPVVYLDEPDVLPPGVRFAVAYGLGTPRIGAFGPYAVLWAGYEFHPAKEGGVPLHIIGFGTRIGLSWDP